ncbi:hypothetical protein [Haloferax sp. ATB1]|uniref:hypothetical protein n=1 Tax=Haloferax sp. ATB1 TaxID=1508454 RepID=UPI000AC6B16C|nr:hypothetical protein [Haloferax sp. ATB1]
MRFGRSARKIEIVFFVLSAGTLIFEMSRQAVQITTDKARFEWFEGELTHES